MDLCSAYGSIQLLTNSDNRAIDIWLVQIEMCWKHNIHRFRRLRANKNNMKCLSNFMLMTY